MTNPACALQSSRSCNVVAPYGAGGCMRRMLGLSAVLVLAAGCQGGIFGGKTTNEAIKWGNRGIAFAQCMQESIKATMPEAASQQCVVQWFPELPDAGANATKIAADLAACVRARVMAAQSVPAGTARQSALIQGVGDCTAQYGPQLFQAIQTVAK